MATLQVKGMDELLYSALRRRAELDNRSISQEVITIIQHHLSQPSKNAENATLEFLKLSGSWAGSEPAEEIIRNIKANRKTRSEKDIGDVFA